MLAHIFSIVQKHAGLSVACSRFYQGSVQSKSYELQQQCSNIHLSASALRKVHLTCKMLQNLEIKGTMLTNSSKFNAIKRHCQSLKKLICHLIPLYTDFKTWSFDNTGDKRTRLVNVCRHSETDRRLQDVKQFRNDDDHLHHLLKLSRPLERIETFLNVSGKWIVWSIVVFSLDLNEVEGVIWLTHITSSLRVAWNGNVNKSVNKG